MANQKFILPGLAVEVCILAGGSATRLDGGKEQLRLAGRRLLDHACALATTTGLPCRVLHRDCVPRCGPLGGIITALRTTRGRNVLFLPCDMPFLTITFVQHIALGSPARAVFTESQGRVGFPFRLARETLSAAESLRREGIPSLQALARRLRAARVRSPHPAQLFNLNTPADLATARHRPPPVAACIRHVTHYAGPVTPRVG